MTADAHEPDLDLVPAIIRTRVLAARDLAFAIRFAQNRVRIVRSCRPRNLVGLWRYSRLALVPSEIRRSHRPIFDVGANVGDWAAAVKTFLPDVTVVAFEPSPTVARTLRRRFVGANRITLHEVALADRVGVSELQVTGHHHNSSLRRPRDMSADYADKTGWKVVERTPVPVRPMDAYLDESNPPFLVKIDVQGAEGAVLRGATRTLAAADVVLIETTSVSHYEDDSSEDELAGILGSNGYREVGRMPGWRSAVTGDILWWDVCYVRSKRRVDRA